MRWSISTLVALVLTGLATPAFTSDVAGSADYPDIGRFKGSEISFFQEENYGKTVFATGPVRKDSDAAGTTLKVEGKITRIFYRVPKGIATLEVFRNFEARAKDANFEILFSGGPDEIKDYPFKYKHPVEILREARLGDGIHYFVASKEVAGATTYVSVLVAPHSGGDGVRVGLIAAQTKAMEMQMVDAKQMQLSIEETGRVVLYGIYFDHDSASIKPESKPTLVEISKLLEARPQLKVIVVGHTDYVGGYDYNMSLSKRRAKAVRDALAGEYGIAGARLKSDGVGYLAPAATNLSDAGRTLNRRVELVQDK
ncbi:MAG: OmpA family protein [Gammaproteobacteria bacterium]|nr:OmpA family protein [Gammaproteobacteria bacterium]